MQREIRFRGMTIAGQWVYGLLSKSHGYTTQPEEGYYISNSAGAPWAYQVRPETIGQLVGLADKNGTMIYEGDIVMGRYKKIKYRVEFIGAAYHCVTDHHTKTHWALSKNSAKCLTVVGNIHQPELLSTTNPLK